MASKDDRMKGKRKNLKKYDRRGMHEQSSSSSQSKHESRGVIDIADSSDLDVIISKAGRQKPIDYPADIDDDNEGNRQLQAADFKQLSELPISIGGHFQFSSEKNWDTDTNDDLFDNLEASEYFTLSLKVLNSGLKTIPFYKRMDYTSTLFTNNQIINMEKSAEDAEQVYQNVLKEYLSQPKIKKVRSVKSQISANKDATTVDEGPTDELDDLLNMTATQVSQVKLDDPAVEATIVDSAVNSNIEDDQKWLDDVLAE